MNLKYKFIIAAFTKNSLNEFAICALLIREVVRERYSVYLYDNYISIEGIYYDNIPVECILNILENNTYKVELYKNNDDYEEILEPFFTSSIIEAYKQFKAYYEHTQK